MCGSAPKTCWRTRSGAITRANHDRRLPASPVRPMRRGLRSGARRFGAAAGILLVGAALLATLAAWLVLRASLPTLDGRAARSGVRASVRVNRDADGVPSITAQ